MTVAPPRSRPTEPAARLVRPPRAAVPARPSTPTTTPPKVVRLAPEDGPRAQSATQRISAAILRTYKSRYGKGPVSVRVHLDGDTVTALLRGGFSTVEESLYEAGRAEVVRDQRRAFADMIAPTLAIAVDDVTGRDVVAVLADTSQDPDLCAIVLVLARPGH